MEGNRQIAGLLWNMFSTWITKLSLLPCYYRVLYIRLVCQQRHEGQCCALYSIQCTERDGMSHGEPGLCQCQLLAELLGLRYVGFTESKVVILQAVWASSSAGYHWKKPILLHRSLHQHLSWRGCTRNEIMVINITWWKKKKRKKYCFQLHQFLDPVPFVALQP